MSHNKMYRNIEGYETALYLSSDIVDVVDDLKELIRYGEDHIKVNAKITEIENIVTRIKEEVVPS